MTKDTGLATEAVDYIHEPVLMHYVLDSFEQLPVPHVLVVRLVLDAVDHCGGRVGTHKTSGSFYSFRPNYQWEAEVTQAVEQEHI